MGGVYSQIYISDQMTDRPLHNEDERQTVCIKNVNYHHGCTEVLISRIVKDVGQISKPDHTSFIFQTMALIVNEPGCQKCIYQRGKRSRVAKKDSTHLSSHANQ